MPQKLFSITTADLREDQYRGSGAGGSNRNKRDTGVRFVHVPSGATGESESERSQHQNRREALRRLSENPKFVRWVNAQVAAIDEGYASLERKVDDMMRPENLKIEAHAPDCERLTHPNSLHPCSCEGDAEALAGFQDSSAHAQASRFG